MEARPREAIPINGFARSLWWVALVLVGLSVTSCAFVPGSATDVAPADTNQGAALVNPMKDHASIDEMVRTTGIEMTIPENAQIIAVRSIGGTINDVDVQVGQTLYNLRKARSGESDISGVYENWRTVEKMHAPHLDTGEVTVSRNSDKGIVTWNDGTYAHSIFAETGFDIVTALELVRP